MDDRMLHEYRREPDPKFASGLRERLRRHERPRVLPSPRTTRILAVAAAAAAVTVVFAVPSVRVHAQAVLDVFRVRRFAAVEFTESRAEKLSALAKDNMIFDREEKILDPGPATYVSSREAAAAQSGISVRAPKYLPSGFVADSIFVQGEAAGRVSVSEAKLRALLETLDLDDEVNVPAGLDGQWVEVRKPPVVLQRFRTEKQRRAVFLQARSPEVKLPAGWDLEQLGEIGLRILGLDAQDAKRIAKSTDWRGTFLVPLPTNATSFRQVTVRGESGLLITTTGEKAADGKRHAEKSILMWSAGDRIYLLRGDLGSQELLKMAESVS